MAEQLALFEVVGNEDYEAFEDKFKPKLTTDDCYTPKEVFDAILNWAIREFGWEGRQVLRPFYPGGDYQTETYPDGCVVIDNPPFSIVSQIVEFYARRGIDYFLYCPALTTIGIRWAKSRICVGCSIVYENGAVVPTSFIASQGPAVRSAPELFQLVTQTVEKLKHNGKAAIPKYSYPDNLITAAKVNTWSKYGVKYQENSVEFVRTLDAQRAHKKGVFGGGFLVPRAAAREAAAREAAAREAAAREAAAREAAAREAAEFTFKLSDREEKIVRRLENGGSEVFCEEDSGGAGEAAERERDGCAALPGADRQLSLFLR